MKRYMLIAFILFGWQEGFCQEKSHGANQLARRGKDSVKVQYAHTYDSPHCTLSQEYDKNGKPLQYTYDDVDFCIRKTKKYKRIKK